MPITVSGPARPDAAISAKRDQMRLGIMPFAGGTFRICPGGVEIPQDRRAKAMRGSGILQDMFAHQFACGHRG